MTSANDASEQVVRLDLIDLNAKTPAFVALITMQRPKLANAFNAEMIKQLRATFDKVHENADIRVVVLRGAGKNFCAGADLEWMQESAALSYEKNLDEAEDLRGMFESLQRIACPVVVAVQGAVYGGAVGLVACADVVVCSENARFCLSEVRVGLIPAVILPFVARRMPPGPLRRHMLSARVFSAKEALDFHFVDAVCPTNNEEDFKRVVTDELTALLQVSPHAQRELKPFYETLRSSGWQSSTITSTTIARVRSSEPGQAGLKAFLTKQRPRWHIELDKTWTFEK